MASSYCSARTAALGKVVELAAGQGKLEKGDGLFFFRNATWKQPGRRAWLGAAGPARPSLDACAARAGTRVPTHPPPALPLAAATHARHQGRVRRGRGPQRASARALVGHVTPRAREIGVRRGGRSNQITSSKLERFARDYASSRLRLLVGAAASRPTTHQWTSAGPAAESLSVGAPKFRPLFYFLLSALSRRAAAAPLLWPPVTGNARERHVRHLFVPVRYFFGKFISFPLREP